MHRVKTHVVRVGQDGPMHVGQDGPMHVGQDGSDILSHTHCSKEIPRQRSGETLCEPYVPHGMKMISKE